MLITNLTSNVYALPGLTLGALEAVTAPDAWYLFDEDFQHKVNVLYANSKVSVADAPGGFPVSTAGEAESVAEGGGSQPFLTATKVLGDDDIKVLPSLPLFELVPAPGTDKIIVPIRAFALLDATAGAYNSDVGRSWQLYAGASQELTGIVEPNTALANGQAQFFLFPTLSFAGAGDFAGYLTSGAGQQIANLNDAALNLRDHYNGVADYTGGDPANSLTVTVYYVIADLAT